jgi:hypothetical protein
MSEVHVSDRTDAVALRPLALQRMRDDIEEQLALWRDAESRRDVAEDGHRAELDAEVEQHRDAFHRLTADYMIERINALKEAEHRRASAQPSSKSFHEAARDERRIASEIWDSASVIDDATPRA